MLEFVSEIVPCFKVPGFWSAIFGAIIISIVSWLLSAFFRGSDGRVHVLTHHSQVRRVRGRVIEPDEGERQWALASESGPPSWTIIPFSWSSRGDWLKSQIFAGCALRTPATIPSKPDFFGKSGAFCRGGRKSEKSWSASCFRPVRHIRILIIYHGYFL